MPFGSAPGVAVKDDGTPVLSPAAVINCGSGLSAANDGAGQVTITASGGTATPGGTNGQIQFNDNGGLGGLDSTGTGNVVRAASPALSGTPTTPTAAANTNTTQVASTAFVQQELASRSYLDGEVEVHADLPVTLGAPPIDSAYLVRESSGVWLINRKPAGIWIRATNGGTLADWVYAGTFADVYSDANFALFDDGDSSKELGFSLGGITAGNKRVWTAQDKSGTVSLDADTHDASSKATPADSDEIGLRDSAAMFVLKKLTWANLKTALASTFVTLAQTITNTLQFAIDIKRQGFLNHTQTSLSFSGTTLTLTDAGSGWSYYRQGVKYTISGNKTCALSAGTAGLYYFYIDATDGTISCSAVNTPWTLKDSKVPVATVWYNSTLTPTYWLADERHTAGWDIGLQYYVHRVMGARLATVPTLSGYTIDTDTLAAKCFAISACTLEDQDITFDVASLSDPSGGTDYVVFYRTSASTWAWKASDAPFPYNIGNTNNRIQWDNGGTMTNSTGGTGGSTRWVNSYLLVTNKTGAARFIIVPGRAIFTSLAAAQSESIADWSWAGFDVDEAIICYRLTWACRNEASSVAGKCELDVAPQQLNLSVATNASSGAGTDHETLANLLGGATNDHYHLTAAEVTAATAAQAQGTASIRAIGTTTPEALGTAAAGTSTEAAAKDHVHQLPAAVPLAYYNQFGIF
jgi:hypothetical protein